MLKKILVIILFPGVVSSYAQKKPVSVGKIVQNKVDYKQIGAPLPEFKLSFLTGGSIVNSDLKSQSNLFVMIFNPLCGHCEDETDSLEAHMSLFKETKIVMLGHPNTIGMLSGFIRGHHVDQYPKMIVGIDSTLLTDKIFLYQGLPQINVYDQNRKLIKTFSGDISIDSMKQYIQ